jgi:hypothetical protein
MVRGLACRTREGEGDDGDGERAVLDPGFQRHGAGVARMQFERAAKP